MTIQEQLSGDTACYPDRLGHPRVSIRLPVELEGRGEGFLWALAQKGDRARILYHFAILPLNYKFVL